MKIKDGFRFDDPVTGLRFKVIKGKKLDRLHVELGTPRVPRLKNRDFFFTREGELDGTGSSVQWCPDAVE